MTKFHPDVAFSIILAASGILMEHCSVRVRARSVGHVMTLSKIMRFLSTEVGKLHTKLRPRGACVPQDSVMINFFENSPKWVRAHSRNLSFIEDVGRLPDVLNTT